MCDSVLGCVGFEFTSEGECFTKARCSNDIHTNGTDDRATYVKTGNLLQNVKCSLQFEASKSLVIFNLGFKSISLFPLFLKTFSFYDGQAVTKTHRKSV